MLPVLIECINRWAYLSRGLNWTLRMGEGNLNVRSQSPDTTSHTDTVLSVAALNNLCPFLFQLEKQ